MPASRPTDRPSGGTGGPKPGAKPAAGARAAAKARPVSAPGPARPKPVTPAPPPAPLEPLTPTDWLYRIGGTAVAVVLAVLTAFWEALLTPLAVTIGGHIIRLPVAVIVAIGVNFALVWFVNVVTRMPFLAVVPALFWMIVIFKAGAATAEGDLLIIGNWVGVLTTFLGAIAWAVAIYYVVVRRPVPRRSATPSAPSTTSGKGSSQ